MLTASTRHIIVCDFHLLLDILDYKPKQGSDHQLHVNPVILYLYLLLYYVTNIVVF